MQSRRQFLNAPGAAATFPILARHAFAAAANPTPDWIFRPENYPIPPDAKMLFHNGVDFIGNGVGLPGGMTVQGYEEAVPRILPRAMELAQKGANVISVFGSSITFCNSKKADAVVISWGAPKTIDVIIPVENVVKVPVISSTPHGLWHGVKLPGVPARVQGFGMVMAKG